MPRRGFGRPKARDAWDDDAWAYESDDDEFVARITATPPRPSMAVPTLEGRRASSYEGERPRRSGPGVSPLRASTTHLDVTEHTPGPSERAAPSRSPTSSSHAPLHRRVSSSAEADGLVAGWAERQMSMPLGTDAGDGDQMRQWEALVEGTPRR